MELKNVEINKKENVLISNDVKYFILESIEFKNEMEIYFIRVENEYFVVNIRYDK